MKAEGTGTEAPGRRHLKGGVGPSGSSKSEAEKTGREGLGGRQASRDFSGNLRGLQRGSCDTAHSATDS